MALSETRNQFLRAPFAMRLEHLSIVGDAIVGDPTFELTNVTDSTTIVAATNLAANDVELKFNGETSPALANRDVDRGDILRFQWVCDADDTATTVTVCLYVVPRGHINLNPKND